MFEQTNILIFFHLIALIVAFGGSFFEVFILPSILKGKIDPKDRITIISRSINLFTPINFGMLAIIVFTGVILIFSLYEKISNISSPLYLNVFFVKILLVTIIFSIAAFQTFHLRFKIVHMNADKIKGENLPKPFGIMQTCSKINIILIAIVILLGTTMSSLA